MELEEEEWVVHAIKEAERRKCIAKVLSMERKDAAPEGNNFVSDIYRLKVRVLTNSGDLEERSVIYKLIPTNEEDKLPGIRDLGLFKIEARMYQDTLAAMGRLLKSKDPSSEPLWPEFYGVKGNYDGFLLEDISVYGYVMINRQKGLDFQHAVVCLQNLAKFHALAAVVLDEGAVYEKDFLPHNFFLPPIEDLKEYFGQKLNAFAKAIKLDWPSEWHSYADGLEKLLDKFSREMLAISENKENMFKTINHGDFWMSNVLFKYDSSGALLNTIRIIDFQLCYVHSPCYDIQYLFSTSLRLEFYDKRRELLEVYHESLEKDLKRFGYSKAVPTFEELQRDLETTRLFHHFITLLLRSYMRNPPVHELVEKFGAPDDENKRELAFRYDGEEYLATMRLTLQQLKDLGYL